MKSLILTIALMLVFCIQSNKVSAITVDGNTHAENLQLNIEDEDFEHCFRIDACGAKAQRCDGGRHGKLKDYVYRLRAHFC